MTRRITAFLLGLALSLAAHGGLEHITGTVKSITDQAVVVETVKHEMVTVKFIPKTVAMKSGVKASLKDLKAGERVAIHAAKTPAGTFEAAEVEWGPTAAAKK